MTLTFNELRRIKDSLPDGSMKLIAKDLGVSIETVRNYFGGANFERGDIMGVHYEPGPDGGVVRLDNTDIYERAISILGGSRQTAQTA